MATKSQLLDYRKSLAELRTAKVVLDDNSLDTTEVAQEIAKLADWVVGVDVPCVICSRIYPVATAVDDPERTVPNCVLCKDCDARIGVSS